MKTLILHLKRFSIYSLMFASIGFVACEDENRQDMTPEIGEGEATPKITMYTPTAGGKSTSLTLYGTHFGTDLDNIRVTVNGVDAEVTGALGNIITANVQRGSGSGPVKVYIGQGEAAQELTYKTEFEYSQSPIVSTYIGSYVPSEKTEKKEGTSWKRVFGNRVLSLSTRKVLCISWKMMTVISVSRKTIRSLLSYAEMEPVELYSG